MQHACVQTCWQQVTVFCVYGYRSCHLLWDTHCKSNGISAHMGKTDPQWGYTRNHVSDSAKTVCSYWKLQCEVEAELNVAVFSPKTGTFLFLELQSKEECAVTEFEGVIKQHSTKKNATWWNKQNCFTGKKNDVYFYYRYTKRSAAKLTQINTFPYDKTVNSFASYTKLTLFLLWLFLFSFFCIFAFMTYPICEKSRTKLSSTNKRAFLFSGAALVA